MTDIVEVTQADRDAVRAFHEEMGRRLMSDIRHGTSLLDAKGDDSEPVYQAFARHRLSAAKAATIPPGWRLVPNRATVDWYHSYANWRQGQRSTPSCEPPGGRDLAICRDLINEVLASAPSIDPNATAERV